MSRRTIIIGDLHGCYDEAVDLLNAINHSPSDRVIFTGDLVDRGPSPRECIELAMQYECVLGNHEEKHLRQRYRPDSQLSPDHLRTRQALDDRHYAYFASLPLSLRLPEYNAAVVHAGCFPGVALDRQSPSHLLHLQHINPPNPKSYWPSKAPSGYSFWSNHWRGPERVIFGHSVLDRPLMTPHAVGVDTGAVFGRGLTAVILPEWRFVTVPSRRDHAAGKKTIATYPIQNGVLAFS